jgi:hypothetical protein
MNALMKALHVAVTGYGTKLVEYHVSVTENVVKVDVVMKPQYVQWKETLVVNSLVNGEWNTTPN